MQRSWWWVGADILLWIARITVLRLHALLVRTRSRSRGSVPLTGTILVVDDEPSVRFLLKVLFELEGYRVVEAQHGHVALDLVKTSRPDLIVTDVMMPVMDGRQLIEKLRSNPETASIPIVVISANPDVTLPADATVRKPFRSQDLYEAALSLLPETA